MSENEVRYIHQKTSGEEQGAGGIEEPEIQPYFPSEEEERLENEELVYELAQLYKVFGDETRIRILRALLDKEEAVGSLSEKLQMSMSALSLFAHSEGRPAGSLPQRGQSGILQPL